MDRLTDEQVAALARVEDVHGTTEYRDDHLIGVEPSADEIRALALEVQQARQRIAPSES